MKNRMKPLLPSLKEKKRFLVFEIIAQHQVSFRDAAKSIVDACYHFMGTLGLAKAGIMVLPDQYHENKGIIRVSHRQVNKLKASLLFINTVNHEPVIVRSLGLSGILKKAQKYR